MPLGPAVAGEHIVAQVGSASVHHAELSAQRGGACHRCKSACGAGLAARAEVRVTARTSESLQAGQSVHLEADPGALAQISLLLYFFPAAGFVAGAFCALMLGLGDLSQGAAGLVGLVAVLWLAQLTLRQHFSAGAPLSAVQFSDK